MRAICSADRGQVRVFSRNGRDVSASYPELDVLGQVLTDRGAVIDGEIVALEAGDRPSFSRLQQRIHVVPTAALLGAVPVQVYVFDLLQLDGEPVVDQPYQRRRELLDGLGLHDLAGVRVPAYFVDVDGATMLRTAELSGFEGVVAKRLTSAYRPGRRSPDWVKVPSVSEPDCSARSTGWAPA